MKINKIEYKLTTTKMLLCHKCKQPIDGKEGYIKISFARDRGFHPIGENFFIKICHKCFEEAIKTYFTGRRTRVEDWKRLLKKRILFGLR